MKYKEKQKVNDRILFGLLLGCTAGLLGGFIYSAIVQGLLSIDAMLYLAMAIVTAFVYWWYRQLNYKISINEKRIKFKLSPYDKQSHKISWDEVESCRIISEPNIKKWTGHNIHFSDESWYTLSGRNGMHIRTKDGQNYILGCRNTEKLRDTLDELGLIKS